MSRVVLALLAPCINKKSPRRLFVGKYDRYFMGYPRSTTVVRCDFLLLVDFYYLRSLFLLLIDKVCVYLGGAYIFVGKHFADCVDVGSSGNH